MSTKDVVPVFKLADLLQLYTDRLIELGVDITGRIHSTYLEKLNTCKRTWSQFLQTRSICHTELRR